MEASNYSTIIDSNNKILYSDMSDVGTYYRANSTMPETYDKFTTITLSEDAYISNIASDEVIINKTQPTCKSKKNLSPKRFAKRRTASRISRKSRHRRQQHNK